MKYLVFYLLLAFVGLKCNVGQQIFPPYTCTTTICQSGSSSTSGNLPLQGPKGEKGDACQYQIADNDALQALKDKLNSNSKLLNEVITAMRQLSDLPENCSMAKQATSLAASQESWDTFNVVPIYPLKFIGDITPWMVNCTKILSEGKDGWIVMQRRQDGTTDFYRNWERYASGFGNRHEEFWLGLRNIHKITTKRSCKLRIDMRQWDGVLRYAEYSTFQVADENSLFRLKISGYVGNAVRDSMAFHNGRPFSTFDRENDNHASVHCAQRYKGAWWYRACLHSNLNGQYIKTPRADESGIWWYGLPNSLPFVEMKLLCS